MISENAILYDLLKMLYINSAKKEAQQIELSSFNTFAFLFWDSLASTDQIMEQLSLVAAWLSLALINSHLSKTN